MLVTSCIFSMIRIIIRMTICIFRYFRIKIEYMSFTGIRYHHLIVFSLICLFTGKTIFASEIDSLQSLLLETHDANKKIELYTTIAKLYTNSNLDQSRSFIDLADKLSTSISSETFKGEIYSVYGDIAVMQDSLSLAASYYLKAAEFFKLENNEYMLSGIFLVLGNIYLTHDNFALAIVNYLKGIDYAERSGRTDLLPHLYMNIGSINYKSGHIEEAQKYYSKSIEQLSLIGDTISSASGYSNLGLTYLDLGESEIAKEYLFKSLQIYKKYNSPTQIAVSYAYLAKAEKLEKNYLRSLEYLDSAFFFIEKIDPSYKGPKRINLATIVSELGEVYFQMEDYSKAINYLRETYQLGKMNQQLMMTSHATHLISEYWEKFNSPDSALFYHKLYKAYSDSIYNEDNLRQLAYQKAKFQFEQEIAEERAIQETELEIQKRNSLIFILIIVGLLLLLALLILYLKLSKNREKNALLKHESLENELEIRNKELTTHVLYRLKNNEFILEIINNLKQAIPKLKPENQSIIEDVIRKIEIDPYDETWKEFEMRFQNVHTSFYKNLADKFPELTSNDLKLAAFMKLNMSSKDISAITYQSINSIDVARSRLRKKLGLSKNDNLTVFLSQF